MTSCEYEYLRIEYLLTKSLLEYQRNDKDRLAKDADEIESKRDEIKLARKLVDEMLGKAKLKALALSKGELSKAAPTAANSLKTRGTLGSDRNAASGSAAENQVQTEFEKLKQIRDQVEATEEKYNLSKEAIRKLLDQGPGMADLMAGTLFNPDEAEEPDLVEDEEAEDSERMRTIRVLRIHRANVQKANMLIRCLSQLPYGSEPRVGSAEMKRIGAVIEAVLSGTYEVDLDF